VALKSRWKVTVSGKATWEVTVRAASFKTATSRGMAAVEKEVGLRSKLLRFVHVSVERLPPDQE